MAPRLSAAPERLEPLEGLVVPLTVEPAVLEVLATIVVAPLLESPATAEVPEAESELLVGVALVSTLDEAPAWEMGPESMKVLPGLSLTVVVMPAPVAPEDAVTASSVELPEPPPQPPTRAPAAMAKRESERPLKT